MERGSCRRLRLERPLVDNTMHLGHSTWRHVKFVEMTTVFGVGGNSGNQLSWGFSSDVCKHCEHAGCLEAAPPDHRPHRVRLRLRAARRLQRLRLLRRRLPLRRHRSAARRWARVQVHVCYDRQKVGLEAGLRDGCPTESILFGDIDELRARAEATRRRPCTQRRRRCRARRSTGVERRRHSRDVHRARRSCCVQPSSRIRRCRPSICGTGGGPPRRRRSRLSPAPRWPSWRADDGHLLRRAAADPSGMDVGRTTVSSSAARRAVRRSSAASQNGVEPTEPLRAMRDGSRPRADRSRPRCSPRISDALNGSSTCCAC